jgi:RimJ/RimL family protein N-acetyltransferase
MSDVLETEHLLMRPFVREDLDAFAEIFSHDDVMRFSKTKRGLTRAESEEFLTNIMTWRIERGFGHWAAVVKADGALAGYIGLAIPVFLPEILPMVEIGYRLHPKFWGRGYATEGAAASLRYGFDVLDLPEIVAIYEPENVASGRVMQKIGMRLDRTTIIPEDRTTVHVYKMTREEWLTTR